MAVLKQIKFGNSTTPIAMTQVAINENSTKVLSVVPTNTALTDEANPVYTLAIAVDGKTITKTSNEGLATALGLAYFEASGEGASAKEARIALVDNENTELSAVNVSDLIGDGIVDTTSYDSITGILTITFKGGDVVDIDLGELLDIDDIVIASGSSEYLSFAPASPESETGQAVLGVKLARVTGTASTLNVDETNGSLLDASDTIDAVKTYVDGQVENLAVSAQGDNYITADVDANNNKKINVTADVQVLTATAGTPGSYDAEGAQTTAPVVGSLSGTANSLVDGADVAAKVKTYVDGAVAIEVARADAAILAAVQSLDATVGSTTVDTGKHVAVQVVEENGKLTSLTVTEDDIASNVALSAEIGRAQTAESEIADKVGLTGAEGSRDFSPTTNYGEGSTTVMANIQAIDTKLKEVEDATSAIQYKVTGTTLEFFGMSEKTTA